MLEMAGERSLLESSLLIYGTGETENLRLKSCSSSSSYRDVAEGILSLAYIFGMVTFRYLRSIFRDKSQMGYESCTSALQRRI